MANLYQAPLDDLSFTVRTIGGLSNILAYPPYGELSPELVRAVQEEAARFAESQLAPLNRSGDLQGASISDAGEVSMPEGFAAAYHAFVAQGWNAAPFPTEHGGQGLPYTVSTGLQEIWHGANLSFALTPLLTHSAVHMLIHYGSDWEKQTILPKLVSGQWAGTMCMTEPQAGSDVGTVRTQAIPQADGTYRLKGTKIFISCGDQDATENIIHMVLARLPDAPQGSRGLSVFMVPKFLVNEDGSLGARNDVHAVSLEHKMGMHASPTAVMAYGDNEGAVATLVGKANEGLSTMFTMMNSARLAVGLEGLGTAQYATQLAKEYASERVQSRALASGNREPVTIDQHNDVKRMLAFMESHVQGLRALSTYIGALLDTTSHHPDTAIRAQAKARLDLLTPVMKAHTTNVAFAITSEAMQVHGGLGYVEETGVAQLMRDVRVSMIYEGTNGIQALDLAGRKLPMDGGKVMEDLIGEISTTVAALRDSADYTLMPLGDALATAATHLQTASQSLLAQVLHTANNAKGEAPSAASAVPFLTLLGLVMEGHLLGKSAIEAQKMLQASSSDYAESFLKRKLELARFFMLDTLLDTGSLSARVLLGDTNLRDPGPGET